MPVVPAKTRQQVIERAGGRCEYCLAPELVGVAMELDHILPLAEGGGHDPDNLCLACRHCNGFKSDFTTGLDPENNTEAPLYNPRTQNWQDHFRWDESGAEITGITPTGRGTISRLGMNHEKRLIARQYWVRLGLFPPE